jgi:hypothetical protein
MGPKHNLELGSALVRVSVKLKGKMKIKIQFKVTIYVL